jgi:stage V sporulation protein S
LSINIYEVIMEVLRVSANSQPTSVAGALSAVLRDNKHAEMQAVGAAVVNQAVKAIAIIRGFVAPRALI